MSGLSGDRDSGPRKGKQLPVIDPLDDSIPRWEPGVGSREPENDTTFSLPRSGASPAGFPAAQMAS